ANRAFFLRAIPEFAAHVKHAAVPQDSAHAITADNRDLLDTAIGLHEFLTTQQRVDTERFSAVMRDRREGRHSAPQKISLHLELAPHDALAPWPDIQLSVLHF